MTDPQRPEDLPERPPLPPRTAPGAGEQQSPPAPAPYPAQTPPPNPYGQAPTGRHAPQAPPAHTEFAPPSSPGFGPQGSPVAPTPPAQRGPYGQSPQHQQYPQPQPQYGQQANGQSAYPGAGATHQQPYPSAAPVPASTPARPASRLGTTGVVLGGVGVLGGIIFGWTLPLSIVAIVLGFIARSREPHARGVALAAIVTGIIGLLLSAGWLAYSIITWLALTSS